MMQVTYVKRYLEMMHNVKTLGVIRPTKSADGAIRVTDNVHIQVPTNGTALNVVRRSGLTFHFYPDRTKWNELLSDLQQAMSEVQS